MGVAVANFATATLCTLNVPALDKGTIYENTFIKIPAPLQSPLQYKQNDPQFLLKQSPLPD